MNSNYSSLNKIIDSTKLLSTADKVKLIKQVSSQIEQELKTAPAEHRKPLRGLWRGLEITDKDISETRKEMWQDFPGKDI